MRALALTTLLAGVASGCGPAEDEVLHCRDLLPASETRYEDVAALVTAGGGKGCAACHNTETPLFGYNFEGPAVAYDALTTKIDLIYTMVASGTMPKDGVLWEPSDLKLLRSWYCYGGAYE